MKKVFTIVFVGLVTNLVFCQSILFKPLQADVDQLTKQHLKKFNLVTIEPEKIRNTIDAIPGNVKELIIRTQDYSWNLEFFEYTLLAPNAVRNTTDAKNPKRLSQRRDFRTFKGHIKGNSQSYLSLSLADGFFKLMVDDGKERFFIEPLNRENWSVSHPGKHQFIVYNSSDVNPIKGLTCGAELLDQKIQESHQHFDAKQKNELRMPPCPKCVEVQIALAADYTMFSKYLTVADVENQMFTIMADVQTVFDNEFQHQYEYQITGTFVADDVQRDPWNGIRDIFEQLETFAGVAPTIFNGSAYAVATNWSAKYMTGVIGVAYLSQVCQAQPYNVCSDFNLAGGRLGDYLTLQAHELGHNWSMQHDPDISPTIMAPVINGSTRWSANSVFSLNNFVNINDLLNTGCLSICPGTQAPTADFAANITYGCQPVTIKFTNLSQYTDKWEWSFPGGMPSSSTAEHPTVIYRVAGRYEVTLKAKNSRCEAEEVKIDYIEINDVPIASFSFGQQGKEVFFIDQSQRADEYFWDFGDGNTSEEANPFHVYDRDTTYTITLRVKNDCGMHTFKRNVSIVSIPVADFEADTTGGCAPKFIKFFDRSTNNVKRWQWEFKGGSPSVSTEVNPVVRYDNPGVYDVRLTVYASRFDHALTKKLYITIDSLPDAEFDFNANGNQVDFTSLARYAKSHFWNFGDNNTSTDPNPSHNYTEGRYDVMYVSINACGSDTAFAQVTIGQKPIAGFQVGNNKGCIPYQVQFQNTSTAAATAFKWYFPGGNPSASTDKDPVVTYNAIGSYDVSLVAYNPLFSDSVGVAGFVEVNQTPTSTFVNSIAGFKVFFTNQSTLGTNYFWDFGDNQISFDKDPEHEYGAEGEYNIRLVTQNECGWDTFDKKIAVYLIPKVNYAADTLRGCPPLTVQFLDRSSIDVIEWDWQFQEGEPSVSNEKNPKVVFKNSGKFTVKLTVKNTNGTNALTRLQYIHVLSPVLCPEFPKGDRSLLNSDINVHPFGSGVEKRSQQNNRVEVEPYLAPNPSNGQFFVWSDASDVNPVKIEIFNLGGESRFNKILKQSTESIALKNIEAGNYFVKFSSAKNSFVIKLILL
ncbi:MAG: PKD domain-containing protein [Saprospiraceae bacterium]|nr:PKD domain-containing protein [Saprospiraceae bacterium]